MTKALLMLTGGRSLPDLLTLKYLRPDIAFNVTTSQGRRANALYFKEFSRTHFGLEMEVIPDIDRKIHLKQIICINSTQLPTL